jgi:hypothetical protein
MRRALTLAVLAGLLSAAPAEAAKTVDVPGTFKSLLPKVRARTMIPILLPSSMKLDFDKGQRLYRATSSHRGGYDLELSAAPRCGANVCFAASFSARGGSRLGFAPNATLTRGIAGHFQPLRCGGSCTPPSIAWVLGGVRYEIQAKALRGRREDMVAAANSAIRAGRR